MACCGSKPQGGGGGAGRPKAPVPVRSAKDEAPAPSGAAGTAADLGPNTQQPGPKAGVIHTTEELPPSLQYWPNGENRYIRVSKSTYPANAPNEDRCTFAADTDTGWIFAGVWDGHAGGRCAEWVDQNITEIFLKELEEQDDDAMVAFQEMYLKADKQYISEAEQKEDAVLMCCGTCAVGAYIEYGEKTSQVTVGNLGDSRAIAGKFRGNQMFVEGLSEDHSVATSPAERTRLRSEFPDLPAIITMGDEDLEEHGTVMGLCRFTRSIGDCHMKSTGSAEAFNSWHSKNKTGLHIRVPEEDKQYISSTAECRETSISDGFILIACDGIWDEMDNKEAADICGKILVKTAMDKTANVADMFVAECLKKAATRVADEFEEEEDLTVEELRRRPCGKTPGARSLLHDDMTVIVIDFVDLKGLDKRAKALKMDMPPSPVPAQAAMPMIDPRLLAASEAIQPGASTPPAQRRGTKSVSNKRRGSVMLSLNAPPPAGEGGGRVPAMALDGGEGQGKGKTRGQAKGLKNKRRGSSTGAVGDMAAMQAATEAAESGESDQ